MSQPVRNKRPAPPARAPEPARKAVIFPVIVVAVLLVGGVAGYWAARLNSAAPPPPAPEPAPSAQTTVPSPPKPTDPRVAATPQTIVPRPTPVPAPPPAVVVVPNPFVNYSSPELVNALTQLDVKNPVTPDQAQAWKQALQQLVRQGPTAIPAITNFLAQNLDSNFAGVGGADQLGYPSLRAGLLDALAQIGGPDATAAMLQVLQTSTYPADVAQLLKSMGQPATAEYQQDFLAAVRQQLLIASQPQAGNSPDVGPLFQVLATEGASGAQVAQDIQQYGSNWSFYSAITLANLPNGAGLSALVDLAQTPGTGQAVAVDSLAQMAAGNPQALSALLEMAKSGQISDYALESAAPFLAGRQFVLSSQPDLIPPGAQVQTIHMSSGNQNFTSFQWYSPAQIPQQIGAIDQLLQVLPPSDTDTLAALQQQKSTLNARLGR